MGLLKATKKKLKKKGETPLFQKAVGSTKAKIDKAEVEGIKQAEANMKDIEKFCHAYWTPIFYYISHRTFGLGSRRIKVLEEGIAHIFELLKEPKYLDLNILEEGFDLECRMKLPKFSRREVPTINSVNGFANMYAYNASLGVLEVLRMVWLWVLHDKFGFSKKRLTKAIERLDEMMALPRSTFYAIVRDVESTRKWKGDTVSLSWSKNALRELDVGMFV